MTPATSFSTEDIHAKLAPFDGPPALALDTGLLAPQELVFDGPITESPTEDSNIQGLSTQQCPAAVPWSDLQYVDLTSSSYHSFPPSVPDVSEEFAPPPYQPIFIPPEVHASRYVWPDILQPERHVHGLEQTDSSSDLDDIAEACRQYANEMFGRNPSVIVTYLEDAFDLAVGYWHEKVDTVDSTNSVTLQAAFSESPSIEAALHALQTLLATQEATGFPKVTQDLTSHRLISLVFLSFSLLCLANPKGNRLTRSVIALHRSAKSWTCQILDTEKRGHLEQLIDKMWLLAEQSNNEWEVFADDMTYYDAGRGQYRNQATSDSILSDVALIFIQREY